MNFEPRVIQVALDDWLSSARLPKELNAAGLRVDVLCSATSPLRLTRCARSVVITTPDMVAVDLERLIHEETTAAIIPSDERTIRRLHALAVSPTATESLRALLRHSLGAPSGYDVLTSKWRTAEVARRLNIAVPRQRHVSTIEEAEAFVAETGLPVILKRENTYGGMGCRVCRSASELRHGFKRLRRPSWLRRGLRWLGHGGASITDETSLDPLIIQEAIDGQLAFVTAVAKDGSMISGVTVVAEQVYPVPTGASTVVRHVENSLLMDATRSLLAETKCSGFVAIDFIIDRRTGQPYLLEINPRVTPLCHLGRLFGTDLCGSFASSLAGVAAVDFAPPRSTDMIAFFPNEWIRDPESQYLKTAYHDVPTNDPALIGEAYRHVPFRRRCAIRLGLAAALRSQTVDSVVRPVPVSSD